MFFSYVCILESRNIPRSECIGSKVISIFSSWDSLKRQYILDYECHVGFWYCQNPAFSLLNSVCNLKSYKMVPAFFWVCLSLITGKGVPFLVHVLATWSIIVNAILYKLKENWVYWTLNREGGREEVKKGYGRRERERDKENLCSNNSHWQLVTLLRYEPILQNLSQFKIRLT